MVEGRSTVRTLVLLLAVVVAGACSTDGDATGEADDAGADPQASDAVFGRIPGIVQELEPSVVAVFSATGEGSGVVWDEGGTIVTNHHVVSRGDRFEVAFADGARVGASLVASDPLTDLAVLRAEREGLPAAEFESSLPEVGEMAVAMGNPLGFENTVTAGIVSGLHRSIPGSAPDTQSLIDLIQTDAAISPGNSGGALVDAEGRVIGINVAYIPPQARAVSIGFAIPSATVVDVVEQLLDDGSVSHSFFGVQPGPLTDQIRRQLAVDVESGIVVRSVVPDGPAAEAGVRPGDIVITVDEEPVRTVEEFLASLRRRAPGDELAVEVVREGRSMEVRVTLTDRPRS